MSRYCLVLFMLAASLSAVFAHPSYFHGRNMAKTCTEHPSKAAGGHLPPVTDPDITVTAKQNGQTFKDVCPGETYSLSVQFGGQQRAALVTVSGGTLTEANVAGCTNAIATAGSEMVSTIKSSWEVPCSLLGRVEVKVTTATNATGAWLKGATGFTILPISKCPGYSKCKVNSLNPHDFPAPPKINETALKPGSNSNPNSNVTDEDAGAAGPLFFAVNQPVGLGGSLSGGLGGLSRSGRMCAPSNLGYQCSTPVAEGVVVHYTYGGQPPANVCTNKTVIERSLKNSTNLMHFAVETEQQGYVGLGFPLAPGRMVPADAVVGRLDNATGVFKVHTYRLTAQNAGGIKPAPGWAHAVGAVRRYKPGSSSGSVLMVCFTREALAKASIVPNLDPSMVPLIWSSHSQDSLTERHDKDGSLIINMLSGQHAVQNKHDRSTMRSNYIMHIAHGSAMIAAFCLMMPLAGLVARHRWVFTPANQPYNPTKGGGWFHFHLVLQILGCVAAIGSYTMAMVLWFRKHSLGFERHLLYAPHCELGTGVMAMVGVQLLIGLVRACLPERHLGSWKMMHSMWGWATVTAGGANCVIGTFLMRDLIGMPWLPWLLPVAGCLGGLMLVGMMLEVPRMRRVKEICCWDDDLFSDTTSAVSPHHGRPKPHPAATTTTPRGAGAANGAAGGHSNSSSNNANPFSSTRPTLSSEEGEEFVLSPRPVDEGFQSPRLARHTPPQIRTV